MDDAGFTGEPLSESFRFIKFINLLGGGQRTVISGLNRTLAGWPKEKPVEILDVGCGLGDIGLAICRWGDSKGITIRYSGLEKNENILNLARKSTCKENIEFVQGDLFSERLPEADVIILSMVLHHFDDEIAVNAVSHLCGKARHSLIVNDLERSGAAYLICWLLTLMLSNPECRMDALLSVRKGFTPEELKTILEKSGKKGFVRRSIGFRLLGIIPLKAGGLKKDG